MCQDSIPFFRRDECCNLCLSGEKYTAETKTWSDGESGKRALGPISLLTAIYSFSKSFHSVLRYEHSSAARLNDSKGSTGARSD
jgi:hypothetical protein